MLFESAGGAVWCFAPAGRYSATNIFAEQKSSLKRNIMLKSDPSNTTETTMFHYYDFPEKERKTHLFQTMIFREGYKHVSIQQYPLVFFIVFFWEEGSFNGWRCFQRCFQLHWLGRTTLAPDVFFLGSRRFLLGTFRLLEERAFFPSSRGGKWFVCTFHVFCVDTLLRAPFCLELQNTLATWLPPNRDSRESLFGKRPSWKQGGLLQYPAFFLNGPEPSTTKKTRGVLTGVIIGLQLTPPL